MTLDVQRHGENEQARWRKDLDNIRLRYSDWISSILGSGHITQDQQIENLIDSLMTWQQLAIQLFDTLEISKRYVDDSVVSAADLDDYAHTYSNAVHSFEEAGVDAHITQGVKEHLIERFD